MRGRRGRVKSFTIRRRRPKPGKRMTYPKSTLVVHTGGLGDFLLACPAIAALAREGRVELLGNCNRLELAVAAGIATAAHDIERTGFDSLFTTPTATISDFLAGFGRCIVWMRDDGTLRQAIQSCGIPEVHTFAGIPPAGWHRHATAYYADALGFEGLSPFRLPIAAPYSHDIVIHPGSGGRRKNWPWDRFLALAAGLMRAGRQVTWCLGPAEEEGPWNAVFPVIHPETPIELARHLAGTAVYIGNDSGATHLAAAVGCATVAIFGPTDPEVWAPYGARVVRTGGSDRASSPWPGVAQVLEAALG